MTSELQVEAWSWAPRCAWYSSCSFLFSSAKYHLCNSVKMSITLGRPTCALLSQASIDSSILCNGFRIKRCGVLRTETQRCEDFRASTPTPTGDYSRGKMFDVIWVSMILDHHPKDSSKYRAVVLGTSTCTVVVALGRRYWLEPEEYLAISKIMGLVATGVK